jgi:hypothetical protein
LETAATRWRAVERAWVDRAAAAAEGAAARVTPVAADDARRLREIIRRWRTDWKQF